MFNKNDDFKTTLKKLKELNGESNDTKFNDDDDISTTLAKLRSVNQNRSSLYNTPTFSNNVDINNVNTLNDVYDYILNNGKSYEELNKEYNESKNKTTEDVNFIKSTAKKDNIALSNNYQSPTNQSINQNAVGQKAWERNNGVAPSAKIGDIVKQNAEELARQKKSFSENIEPTEEYADYFKRNEKINPTLEYAKNIAEVNEKGVSKADEIFAPFLAGLDNIRDLGGSFKQNDGTRISLPSINDIKAERATQKNSNSWLYQTYAGLTESLGNMAPGLLLSAIPVAGKALGTTYFGASTFGSARNQALLNGYDTKSAETYAVINTTLELGLGKLMGGATKSFLGTSFASKVLNGKLVSGFIKNPVLSEYVSDIISEFGEEYLQEWLDPKIQAYVLDHKDIAESWDSSSFIDQQNFQAGLIGAISAGLTNLPGTAIKNSQLQSKFNAIVNSLEKDGNLNLSKKEIKQLKNSFYEGISGKHTKTTNENSLIDTIVQNMVNENPELNIKEVRKQITEDLENGNISLDDIEKSLGGEYYNNYQSEVQKQEEIQQEIEKLENMKDNELTVKQREQLNSLREELSKQTESVDNLRKQLSSYVNDLTQNDSLIRKSYDEYANKGNAYNVDLSKVKKSQRDTYQRAIDSGVLNNTNRSHDFVDLIAKLEEEKGVKFDFTNNEKLKDTRFALDGKQVNGYIDGDNIVLNMDTDKALNSVIGHEITHVLEGTDLYESLQNAVKEYATTKGEYEVKLNDLRELYKEVKDANIERELTADFIGDYLFTDEEFVKRLSTQNRNLFQKIYDEIKYLSRLITSGSKEGRQLEKLKHTFEKVYRETTENQSTNIPSNTKYKVTNDNGKPITFLRYQKNAMDMSDDFDYNQSDVSHKTGFGINFSDSDMYTKGKDSKDVLKTTITAKKGLLTDTNTKVPKKQIDALNEIFNKYIPDVTMFSDDITDGQLIDQINTASELIANAEDNNTGRKAYVEFYNVINKDGYIRTEPDGSKLLSVLSKESIDAFNNTNRKSDQNVKYSISEKTGKLQENGKDVILEASNVGNKGTLMALHNISEDKLNGVLELNGIPVPSIAITNPEKVEHKGYGDGTLIFDKSTIDPKNKLNEVYDRDVWSPRFPNIAREIIDKNIDKAANNIGISDSSLQSLAEEYNNVENLAYRLSRDTDIVEKFLDDNNIKYTNEDNVRKLAEENGIMDYLNNELKDIYGKKGIYNEKSYLDDNGNRRTFWQMHDEYTLENIVKNLTRKDTKSSETTIMGAGFGNIQANMANKLGSIEDIKQNESKIMSSDMANEELQKIIDEFNVESNELSKLYGDKFDPFWDMDSINYQLQELSKSKNINRETFYDIANTYNPILANADINLVDDIVETMNKLKSIPTDYFEAKPQRAVGLDEIGVAVIPNTWSNDTKQALTNKGVNYIEYDPNVEGDRQRIENMYDEFKFSLSNQNEDVAPIGNYQIKGEDIKLQDIAPIENPQQEEINSNDVYAQFGKKIENDRIDGTYQAPIQTTNEVNTNTTEEFPTINNDNFVENLLLQQERKANAKNAEKQQALNNRQMEIDTNKRSGLKDKLNKAWRTWQYLTTNSNTEIDHLSKETNNPRIKHTGDMLNNFMAEAQNDISSYQTDNYGRKIGKSVQELFTKAKENGLENAFNDYLLHYSNIDRHSTGKGSKIPSAVSESLVKAYEEKYPQFKTWGKDVWQFGKNALNNMYEAGLIGEEQRDVLNKIYPHYVPFFENRDLSNYINSTGELKTKNTIKKSRGGATQENLMPVEEALAKYAYSQKKSVRQNDLYKEIVNTLVDARENIDGNFNFDNATLDNLYADENGNYLTAFIDGNPVSVRINQELYDGLKNDMANNIKNLEEKFSLITKPLQKASEINRNILTSWSPTFPITNAIKDFQDALINSKDVKGFIKQYPSAIKELAQNKTELAHQFQALYGAGNIMGDYEIDVNKGKNKNFLRRITRINDIIELAPRFAEFKSSLEKGQSLQEAMYNAREVTTNFGRGGVITKAMNRNGFRFLNASVQGFSKFVRNFSGENGAKGIAAALAKATAFGIAPALFNELAFGGGGDDKDEQYDALPDYIKDNYYLIKTGDGNFVRIPKGRALSVFGSAARRTMELAEGEENAFEGYLDNVNSQIGFNNPEENNIFSPLIQAFGSENGEAWYGGDLVPTRLQSKPQAEQYDETTDEFSKWLGGVLNVSPYKINYVLDQYTGGAGDIALPLMTKEATSEADNPLGIALAPLKDKFSVDSTSDNKYVSDFYDTNEKVKIAANSAFATEKDKLQQKYMSEVSSELAELYKQKREVQNDESLSRSERFNKSQAIKDQINEIAKSGLQNKDSMSVESNYATVGDKSFYKNTKNEWKTISKDELEDINSIGMTDKEKSNYFGAKNSISTITEKYKKQLEGRDEDEDNSEIYNAKKKEIANVVKNSKLTDREKAYLYDKYYGDTRTLNALVDIGMDMDKYIDFDSQLFESDKYANGKTVANSKRNKVFNYINSMDIPYEQRLLLAKLKYNSFDEGNYDIIQYLNNSNISYDDEAKLLKKLGFKVSSDGSVRW